MTSSLEIDTTPQEVRKKRLAPAADEPAMRGVSPPGAPPSSSTVTIREIKPEPEVPAPIINIIYNVPETHSSDSEEELQCRDCSRTFTFSSGEQQFFDEHGFPPPVRCRRCRRERKKATGGGARGRRKVKTCAFCRKHSRRPNGERTHDESECALKAKMICEICGTRRVGKYEGMASAGTLRDTRDPNVWYHQCECGPNAPKWCAL